MNKRNSITTIIIILLLFVLFFNCIILSNTDLSASSIDTKSSDENDCQNGQNELEISPLMNPGSDRVVKPTGNGPYTTSYMSTDIPRVNLTYVPARIYYPSSGGAVNPSGAPYTGIVFAPGAGGTETSYVSTLSTIASWGFIITIVGTGGPCNQEVVDIQSYVIDYYEELNANSSSIFYNKISNISYGASGHSNGGWTAIAGGVSDTRFQAICTLAAAAGPNYGSGQANTANLHVPLQLVAGADDTTFLPSSDAYFQLANPIKSYIKITGSGHGGPFKLEYLVSFFKFWLNNEKDYSTFIYGDELLKDINAGSIQYESDIGLNPNPTLSKTTVYEDELITLTADADVIEPDPPERVIVSYSWDFDLDGDYEWVSTEKNSTTYSYEDNGDFYIRFRIIDNWGLTTSQDYLISVLNKKPEGDAGADITSNENELVYFDGSNSTDTESDKDNLLYQWDFGDGNLTKWDYLPTASHEFFEQGKYSVRIYVKDDDGAFGSDGLTVTVNNIAPIANFSMNKTTVRIGEEILFNASTSWDTPSDIDTLQYLWDFGDSDVSEGKIVKHSYKLENEFSVILTVEDNNEEVSTKSLSVSVLNTPPTCQAMDDITVNEDELVIFSGSGKDTGNDEDSLQYSWNFDVPGMLNSTWDDSADYEFVYTQAGVYNATLIVKDNDNELGMDIVQITVLNIKPIAKFSVSSGKITEDEVILFDSSSSTDSVSDQDTLNFTWNFDDGKSNMYGKVQNYTYTNAGEYNVWLIVTDNNGESDSFSRKIVVSNINPSAKISASNTTVNIGTAVTFSAVELKDSSSDLNNLTISWDFGDKKYGKGPIVTHSYQTPGRFRVILRVVDDDDGSGTDEISITVTEVKKSEGKKTEESNSSLDLIILGTLGVIIIIIVLIILFLLIRKKRSTRAEHEQKEGSLTLPEPGQSYDAMPTGQMMPGPVGYVGPGFQQGTMFTSPPMGYQMVDNIGIVPMPYDQNLIMQQQGQQTQEIQYQYYPVEHTMDKQPLTPDQQKISENNLPTQQLPENDQTTINRLPPHNDQEQQTTQITEHAENVDEELPLETEKPKEMS